MSDVAGSCLSEGLKPVFGEDRIGKSPVRRIGLSTNQPSPFEALD